MHTDAHFVTGTKHQRLKEPCQDYATAEPMDAAAYAIVSDGCSLGGRTDIGARILALATAKAIRQMPKHASRDAQIAYITEQQKLSMAAVGALIDCGQADMLATCLHAYYTAQGGYVHVQGDGVVAWQFTDEHIGMIRYEWSPDSLGRTAPFYPAYSEDGYAGFKAHYGGNLEALTLSSETWEQCMPGGELGMTHTASYTLEEGINGPIIELPPGLSFIAVFTDGATQVDKLDWKETVLQLMAFKSLVGVFARRRMNRFVDDTQKCGKGPIDDLAFAVISTNPGHETSKP